MATKQVLAKLSQRLSIAWRKLCTLLAKVRQGSYGHEKSVKAVKFEIEFPRTGKVIDLGKNSPAWSWKSHGISFFFLLLLKEQKYSSKSLAFQHFVVMEKVDWSWKSHGVLLPNFRVNPV